MASIIVSVKAETPRQIEIPRDILLMVTDYLPRRDFKSLRLVSREFNKFAIDLPFFTDLWFSPHAEDLEAFQGVCAHPQWSKQVKSIIYDKNLFYNWTASMVKLMWGSNGGESDPDDNHPGLISYIRHAEAQHSVDQLSVLSEGILRLPNLTRFQISSQFGSGLEGRDETKFRSPLARSWGEDWLEPPSWDPVSPHISRIIFSAIAMGGMPITEFTTLEEKDRAERAIIWDPAEAFNFESPVLEDVERIFGNLRTLKLRLNVQARLGRSQFSSFAKLLKKAEKIENIFLDFDEPDIDPVEDEEHYAWQLNNQVDLDCIFGNKIFPHLRSLGLREMHLTADSMEEFVRRHRSTLRELKLEVAFYPCLEDERASFVELLAELALDPVDNLEVGSGLEHLHSATSIYD